MVILEAAPLTALFLPKGPTLAAIWHESHRESLVLGYEDLAAYDADPAYLGTWVGPIANRVAHARVPIGDTQFNLIANEGTTCLHGGPRGLSHRVWDVRLQENSNVVFGLHVADQKDGLPGNRYYQLEVSLTPKALRMMMSVSSDQSTLANLAHHPYWRLGPASGKPRHQLRVAANGYLPVNSQKLPTGEIAPVAGTPYDFRTPNEVPVDMPLDVNLCLGPGRLIEPRVVGLLRGTCNVQVSIATTEPGLQMYNGSGLEDWGAPLRDGIEMRPYAGLALEPQGWPDAPHHDSFPSIFLPAGETYRQTTIYHIEADETQTSDGQFE